MPDLNQFQLDLQAPPSATADRGCASPEDACLRTASCGARASAIPCSCRSIGTGGLGLSRPVRYDVYGFVSGCRVTMMCGRSRGAIGIRGDDQPPPETCCRSRRTAFNIAVVTRSFSDRIVSFSACSHARVRSAWRSSSAVWAMLGVIALLTEAVGLALFGQHSFDPLQHFRLYGQVRLCWVVAVSWVWV